MKDLYTNNYKALLKEIKDTNKWRLILYSWIGRQYCLGVSTTQMIYKFNAIPIKIPPNFFSRNRKIYPKIHVEVQETLNSQNNIAKKRTKLEVLHFLISKLTTKLQ